MTTKLFLLVSLLTVGLMFAEPALTQDNEQCRWISDAQTDAQSCQRHFGSDGSKWESSGNCSANTKGKFDTMCCCPVETSRKYLLIGSLVAFFGIVTILSFALRKNETS